MKYTKEQRLDIGRRIYDGEITRYQAAEEYDINDQTARAYMRMYRDIWRGRIPCEEGSFTAEPKRAPESFTQPLKSM